MQLKPLASSLLAAIWFAIPASAFADGVNQLKSFMENARSLKADFSQTVIQKNGKKPQEGSGTLTIQRPGKFRWTYRKPYEQLLVGDGTKLWVYDPDLAQVTVKKLDESLGNSPAALLAGSNDLEKSYQLRNHSEIDGIAWVDASPKQKENTFEQIRLGMKDGKIAAMELHDNFGQTTLIRFNNVEVNPKLNADQFQFTPPKGADVLGDR
ncbi:outer membrane lipoprotein chaperone LolA [Parachitinimonas caeni]|uniref:Outer-membrane lipoprotein carrier protein n=1 Tax=Parachitinimonas caeni TaxID=3031301 RepID=A0ABT7E2I3_9NEIS|nr:outer membrane lipoprotein chaperone LolA [Parachitinimonas caeni]MDK2126526.1 outer membrane lipoprotein chaperone LolA [Parachitinimonas caeni]